MTPEAPLPTPPTGSGPAAADPDEQFAVEVRPREGVVVLLLSGELDHDTVGPLRAALDTALTGARPRLVVDCAGLRFCDSTGLNALLRARLAAEAAGGRLEVSGLPPVVRRLFRLTGADEVFAVHPDLESALATRPADSGGSRDAE
ncbi:STAS domain-containing protein [Streptomyces sp. NPDC089919]|uniref:STAS domain-containing protein n=1 Tax=Streptomyces sp. NPDC089919 TaxID=3155188 RepID=UPI0034477406